MRPMARRDPFEPPTAKKKKPLPFPFVLDELERVAPETRPMFGCTAVYVGDRIVLILRDRGDDDDGVWVAFAPEHRAAVRAELPNLQPIGVFAGKVAGWLKLSATDPAFEESVLHACELIRARDPRFGKVPGAKTKATAKARRSTTRVVD